MSRHRNDVYGKCACLSFAAHEIHLMDEWEKLAKKYDLEIELSGLPSLCNYKFKSQNHLRITTE